MPKVLPPSYSCLRKHYRNFTGYIYSAIWTSGPHFDKTISDDQNDDDLAVTPIIDTLGNSPNLVG